DLGPLVRFRSARCSAGGGERRRGDRGGCRAALVRAVLLDAQPRHWTGPVYLPRTVRPPWRQHRIQAVGRWAAASQRVSWDDAARRAGDAGGTEPSMNSPAHYSLLVVDDEPDLRTLYELTLLREGYDVESAASVDDAWQRLSSRTYSAVITDMRL